jgi:glycosyltransferase involved in cell wall biosynthesis
VVSVVDQPFCLFMSCAVKTLPISLVIATSGRPLVLRRMLESLHTQNVWPAEILVVDSSETSETEKMISELGANFEPSTRLRWLQADVRGAAVQRNQGVASASQPVIGFADDDVILEANCMERLWVALESSPEVGGVSAMITNQKYHEPGAASLIIYRLIGGGRGPDYAGKIIGPAVNLLPADRADMPAVVPVEWLNLGLTLYRKEALPSPPFDPAFKGYSLMEDAALSLVVGRKWKLVNARTARIFHDTQLGSHKADPVAVARMGVLNRDFVARRILHRKGLRYWSSLAVWAVFQFVAQIGQIPKSTKAWGALKGSIQGYAEIVFSRRAAQY